MDLGFAYRFINQYSILTLPHRHNYYEYFLVTEGRVDHIVNGKRETLTRGNLVLIRPNDYHSYDMYDGEAFSMVNISFRTHLFYDACRYLGKNIEKIFLNPVQPPTINILPFPDCALENDHNFLKFFVGNNDELSIRLRFLLTEVLVIFYRHQNISQDSTYDIWFQRILNKMSSPENIEEGIPALLRIAKVSHGHLCRLFQQQLNMTPGKYITRIRMIYSANLLANSNDKILDISVKCGYSSLSHFVTTFTDFHGISPSNYRKYHSQNSNWK